MESGKEELDQVLVATLQGRGLSQFEAEKRAEGLHISLQASATFKTCLASLNNL